MTLARMLAIALLALSACGGPPARGADETTETWTSGDDDALGIATEPDDEAATAEPSEREP